MDEDSGRIDRGGTVSLGTGTWESGTSPTKTFRWKFEVLPLWTGPCVERQRLSKLLFRWWWWGSRWYMHIAQNLKDIKGIQWKVCILLLSLSHLLPYLVTTTALRFLGYNSPVYWIWIQSHILPIHPALTMARASYFLRSWKQCIIV